MLRFAAINFNKTSLQIIWLLFVFVDKSVAQCLYIVNSFMFWQIDSFARIRTDMCWTFILKLNCHASKFQLWNRIFRLEKVSFDFSRNLLNFF